MGLCGFVWVCVSLCGFVWVCVGLCGFVWVCVDLCGFVWVCVTIEFLKVIVNSGFNLNFFEYFFQNHFHMKRSFFIDDNQPSLISNVLRIFWKAYNL